MTKTPDPLTEFADLRRVAIDYAQEASGDIWTDYNLHDPGVTLLEQTCFALSEIAYQASLPMRDLLTNDTHDFCFHNLALFRPRKVLCSYPVTREDLGAWLCSCAHIESVSIQDAGKTPPGLFDMTVVPRDDASTRIRLSKKQMKETVEKAFISARPMGTALRNLTIADPVDVTLEGHIEIKSEFLPETTAAHIYFQVARLLTGVETVTKAATRQDVWDAPERLMAPAQSRKKLEFNTDKNELDLAPHLAKLRSLPGVHTIRDLKLKLLKKDVPTPNGDAVYYRSVPPLEAGKTGLVMTLEGAPVTLNAQRIDEELLHLKAVHIAQADHHIDAPDWDVMKPGRRRTFTQSHVDNLLPAVYRGAHYRKNDPTTLMAEYRGAIDALLKDMVHELNVLPDTFKAKHKNAQDDAKKHRLQVELLDYLIALQGAEMPVTRQSGLHHYHTIRQRHRFEVSWRLDYLYHLPALHAARAKGPDGDTPGGFLTELAMLCDVDLAKDCMLTQTLRNYDLQVIAEPGKHNTTASDEKIELVAATNPFDMLVPESMDFEVLEPDALKDLSPFLQNGQISLEFLAHLAKSDSFVVGPHARGYQVLLDPGEITRLQRIATFKHKDDARQCVANLRATWRHLNRSAETAVLVEHIALRDSGLDCDPNRADLILPGWTARCAMLSYQKYVEMLVDDLAPAHIHVRVHWLSYAHCALFETLHTAAKSGAAKDLGALKTFLDAPEKYNEGQES